MSVYLAPGAGERPVRHAVLLMSPELLVGMFTEGNTSCVEVTRGLPEGTRVVAVEFRYPWIQLVLEHASFAEVLPGDSLPLLDVSCVSLHDHVSQ